MELPKLFCRTSTTPFHSLLLKRWVAVRTPRHARVMHAPAHRPYAVLTPRTYHRTRQEHAMRKRCTHALRTPGASKPNEGLIVGEAPGKQIDESAPVSSAPEKAAPPPPSAAPAATATPAAAAPVPSSAPATAAMPARAADYAPATEGEAAESPLIARISVDDKVEASVAIMTEVEAEAGATPPVSTEAEAEAGAEAEAEESRPPSQRSPTDEMSEAEIAEAAALDEEFKKEARERKEQYAATTKV